MEAPSVIVRIGLPSPSIKKVPRMMCGLPQRPQVSPFGSMVPVCTWFGGMLHSVPVLIVAVLVS